MSRSVVTAFIESFAAGSATNPYDFLAPDIVVTVNGTTPLSGRFEGLEQVRGVLAPTATDVIVALTIGVARLIGRGSRIAALLRIEGVSRRGKAFNTAGESCGCVFSVAGDVITEIGLFPDTSLIDTVLYGWSLKPNHRPERDAP